MFNQLSVGVSVRFLLIYSVFRYILLLLIEFLAPTSSLSQMLLKFTQFCSFFGLSFLIDLLLQTCFEVIVGTIVEDDSFGRVIGLNIIDESLEVRIWNI